MLKVFYCKDFEGYWPVGTSAVIVAGTREGAEILLHDKLQQMGLTPKTYPGGTLVEINMDLPQAIVLSDGNY